MPSLSSVIMSRRQKRSDLSEMQLKAGAGVKDLRRELEQSQAECSRLRDKLSKTEADLRTTVDE